MIKYPLSSETWDKEEFKAIDRVIDSKRFTMGDNTKEFENYFAEYIGSKYAVMVNSGSSANLLAIASLFYKKNNSLNRGDEVIVPAVSWSTTYYPLYQYGLKLKFVDIDLNTLNYDFEILADAVSDKTRMIVVVNLCGNPNDFVRLNKIIKDRNIIIIEDNCESMGATYNGKQTGTFGLMGTFSTFYSHHICTMEGGIIVTADEELYHILLSLRAHGWTRDLPQNNLVSGSKNNNLFEESWKFVLPGYNVRPLEISAAVGIEQMKKLPDIIQNRRENAKYFQKIFKENTNYIIQKEIGKSSWFGFSIIINPNSKLKRDKIIKLLADKNIECRPIFSGNFTRNDVIKYFDYKIVGKLENANLVHKNGFLVGNHHIDIREQLLHLKNVITI